MTEREILVLVRGATGGHPTGLTSPLDVSRAERLEGGLLNEVWRVAGPGVSLIAKYTPPYVASDPRIPLSPRRLGFEIAALRTLGLGGSLHDLCRGGVVVPRVLHHDATRSVALLEDLGDALHLGQAISSGIACADAAARLGGFIGRLHASTLGDRMLAAEFQNDDIQQTRAAVQYRATAANLVAGGVEPRDAVELAIVASELGRTFCQPGECLVMGDLWPPSVLLLSSAPDRVVGLIDWEFVHYGRPAQDVGHLLAHLWMIERAASDPSVAVAAADARRAFLDRYRVALADRRQALWTPTMRAATAVHLACEILARTVGSFARGSPFEELGPGSPFVRGAVRFAAEVLADPDRLELPA